MPASYVDEFLWPRVVILSFMPASYVFEFYDRMSKCRVSWPRAKNGESTGHMIKCRLCWPHAKNDESAGHVRKWFDLKVTNLILKWTAGLLTACYADKFYDVVRWYWVLCPRAMLMSFTTACLDLESAGHVLKWFDLKIKNLILKWMAGLLTACLKKNLYKK